MHRGCSVSAGGNILRDGWIAGFRAQRLDDPSLNIFERTNGGRRFGRKLRRLHMGLDASSVRGQQHREVSSGYQTALLALKDKRFAQSSFIKFYDEGAGLLLSIISVVFSMDARNIRSGPNQFKTLILGFFFMGFIFSSKFVCLLNSS